MPINAQRPGRQTLGGIFAGGRAHPAALAAGMSLLALALLLYHSLAGGTLLAKNPYDSYLLQAQNWLAGRMDIAGGQNYPWLELAIFEGKYYLSFPPVPSVVCLPFAAAGLSLSNLLQAAYALLLFAGVYSCFWQAGAGPERCLFWAFFVCLGSGTFWLASSGGVWFAAQLLNLCFVFWGVFFWLRRHWPAAFFLLALAVGCRPFSVLLVLGLYLPVLVQQLQKRNFGRIAAFSLPPLLVALALGSYNLARFGSPFEFGHSYLPEFMRAEYGQFSPAYFWPNLKNLLRPITLNAALGLEFPLFDGFLFFAANPLFLVWFWAMLQKALKKQFTRADGALLAGFLTSLCALCFHRTMGGWQFGARYTLDLLPFALFWFLRHKEFAPGLFEAWLFAAGCLLNLYGAAYMLGA